MSHSFSLSRDSYVQLTIITTTSISYIYLCFPYERLISLQYTEYSISKADTILTGLYKVLCLLLPRQYFQKICVCSTLPLLNDQFLAHAQVLIFCKVIQISLHFKTIYIGLKYCLPGNPLEFILQYYKHSCTRTYNPLF